MSVQPFYNPKFRAFDANGNPLSGGLLYTYAAGTTTPLATYTTRAGNITNANPVVLDANGEADVWTTPGVDYKYVLKNSAGVTQWTEDNVPSPSDTSTTDITPDPGGLLTLSNSAPLIGVDVTGATTVYYIPYKNDKVSLWNGTAWAISSIGTGLSQLTTDATKSPAAVVNNTTYDLFIWSDSGTLRLSRGPAWTSATVRGTGAGTTELERLDGRWVNKYAISNGPSADYGLYVGTIKSDGSSQLNDSVAAGKRHVWNLHNHEALATFASEKDWPVHAESTAGTAVYGKGGAYGGYFENQGGSNPALGIGAGHAKFVGSNPTASTAYTNTATPISVVKAWATVETDGAGNASIIDGFNVTSASPSGFDLTVTLASAMASTTYAVFITPEYKSTAADYYIPRLVPIGKTTTSFRINLWDVNVGAQVNVGAISIRAQVLVFGRQ